MKIVADAHIWGVQSAFSRLPGFEVELVIVEACDITREQLVDADILLTRSSTQVNEALLKGSRVRFAATATIGDDHFDKRWLDAHGVVWATAAGSSTGSVIEYMVAVFLELHQRGLISIPDTTLGIVGVGRIGSALAVVGEVFGMRMLLNDPPRARVEGDQNFFGIEELLTKSDIITIHTPLLREGDDKTFHLIDHHLLSSFKGRGIINAARGGCVDSDALGNWLDGDAGRFAVLDCWEGEPLVSRRLLKHPQVVIATPHIAGHSLDGKAANTQYVYDALCRHLNVEPSWHADEHLPSAKVVETLSISGETWRDTHAIATALYPIVQDDAEMRSWADQADDGLANSFREYRRNYPVRRSWQRMELRAESDQTALFKRVVHALYSHLLGSAL